MTKTLFSAAAVLLAASPVWAADLPMTSVTESGGNGNAGIIVLLVIGALLFMNGPSTTRNQAPAPQEADDDDIIMKF